MQATKITVFHDFMSCFIIEECLCLEIEREMYKVTQNKEVS